MKTDVVRDRSLWFLATAAAILYPIGIQAQTTPYFLTPQIVPSGSGDPTRVAIDNKGNAVSIGGPLIYWVSGISLGTQLPNAGGMEQADAMNGDGQIAGHNSAAIVLWRLNATPRQLTLPPSGSVDLQDDAGDVVGTYANGVSDLGIPDIAYLLRGDQLYDLGLLPDYGYPASIPTSISPNGKYIVGYADEQYHLVGVSFTVGGKPQILSNIGSPPGAGDQACCDNVSPTQALQVTNNGLVYGFGTFIGPDEVWHTHAALWRDGGATGAFDLGDLTNSNLGVSLFNAANQNGQAVGSASYIYDPQCSGDCPGVHWHAALWNDTTISDLGSLSGDLDSNAVSINSGGTAVGTSTSATGQSRAVIWSQGKITDLNTAIPPGYRSQVILTGADQISDAGFIEAHGYYLGSPKTTTNFLLTPSVPTIITVHSNANPASFGQPVTLLATVKPTSGDSVPRSYVTFADGSSVLGTAALSSSGTAAWVTSNLNLGAHAIKVTFNGYIPDAGSTSPVYTQTVNISGSKTTVQSSVNPVSHGQTFTLTATVFPTFGTPVGTVTFKNGSVALGTSVVSGRTKQAALRTSIKSTGKASIVAIYSGTAGISGSQSSVLNLTVK